jgi:hypothetical protein
LSGTVRGRTNRDEEQASTKKREGGRRYRFEATSNLLEQKCNQQFGHGTVSKNNENGIYSFERKDVGDTFYLE